MITIDNKQFTIVKKDYPLHLLNIEADTARGTALCQAKPPQGGWTVHELGPEGVSGVIEDICYPCIKVACPNFAPRKR